MAKSAKPWESVASNPTTDPNWVLEDDITLPVSALHDEVTRLLTDILRTWVRRTGRDAIVPFNMALRWHETLPSVGVGPDVMVIEPTPPGAGRLQGIYAWKPGHTPPRIAFEVVDERKTTKDQAQWLLKYAASGAHELCIFDPRREGPRVRGGPFVLQMWRRDPDGSFVRSGKADGALYSEQLGAWLVVTDDPTRLRIADDREGRQRWPTEVEQIHAETEAHIREAERLREEAARHRMEAARLREEIARLGKEAALAETERLRGR